MTKATIFIKDPSGLEDFLDGDEPEKRLAISDEYFNYGDYLQIEIDLDTCECRLIPLSEYKD